MLNFSSTKLISVRRKVFFWNSRLFCCRKVFSWLSRFRWNFGSINFELKITVNMQFCTTVYLPRTRSSQEWITAILRISPHQFQSLTRPLLSNVQFVDACSKTHFSFFPTVPVKVFISPLFQESLARKPRDVMTAYLERIFRLIHISLCWRNHEISLDSSPSLTFAKHRVWRKIWDEKSTK